MKKVSWVKTSKILLLFSLMTMIFVGCQDDDDGDSESDTGNWVSKSSFNGDNRYGAVSFTIGNVGYLVGGYNNDEYFTDAWAYNVGGDSDSKGSWSRVADFPGEGRVSAVGFVVGGKGYVGTGFNGEDDLNDFWEFDPAAGTNGVWTRIADFSNIPRFNGDGEPNDTDPQGHFKRQRAIGFSVGGNGYIGTGDNGSQQKDFWKYDVASDTWEEVFGFGGDKRQDAAVFVIDDVAYIGTGIEDNIAKEDFYSFDGTTWTELNDLDDDEDNEVLLSDGVAFSINGKGYYATGLNAAFTISNTVWEYTPSTDSWEELASFEGSSRQTASAFSFDYDNVSRGYLVMGRSGNSSASSSFGDIWELMPDEESDDED